MPCVLLIKLMHANAMCITHHAADLAMLEPNPGAKFSAGCDAASQLSVRLPPYAPGPGISPAEGSAIPGLIDFPPEAKCVHGWNWITCNRCPHPELEQRARWIGSTCSMEIQVHQGNCLSKALTDPWGTNQPRRCRKANCKPSSPTPGFMRYQ